MQTMNRTRTMLTAASLAAQMAVGAAETPEVTAKTILGSVGVKGGLVVQVGCGDGRLTAALRRGDGFVVHGLDADRAGVEKARETIRRAGLYGPVSVARWSGGGLPYTDNLVNLLVVSSGKWQVAGDEIARVLAPRGVAVLPRQTQIAPQGLLPLATRHSALHGEWRVYSKPVPEDIDEWTHYLHDPSGNAVSHDKQVGFLRRMQWVGGPRYGRHHDHMSSASAMVSAQGRLFYIFDHASPFSIQLPSDWQLVARDAFNGTVLWRRQMGPWFSQLQRLKSGPADLPRRLVAVGDAVYATLRFDAPVMVLDAATGETRATFAQTKGTDEILYADGVLYLVVNREGYDRGPMPAFTPQKRILMAVDAETGKPLWEKPWSWVVPGSLAVGGGRAVFFDSERLVALGTKTGKELWQSEAVGKRGSPVPVYFSPCLVLHDDLVFFSGSDPDTKPYHPDNGKTMYAFAADSGKTLWRAPHAPAGYRSAEDILVLQGLVWTSDIFNSKEHRTPQTGTVWGRDPRTGEVKVEFKPDVDTHWFHHRCYRAKATDNYLLTSRTGIEFVDVREKHWTCHHWVRGACLYGIMPANGMVYSPPHPCACYLEAKLYGFNALAADSLVRRKIIAAAEKTERLERGAAYALASASTPAGAGPGKAEEWPTLRADPSRSGRVRTQVPARPELAWRSAVANRLSSPVAAGGKVFVSAIDAHEVHALDAGSGKAAWRFIAGGRVDSPPTIWNGRALFGCADGYVYCLRADDGRLMWRYRAAPADMRMGAWGQTESVWPVHGSVLIRDNAAGEPELWCAVGRSMFLDGGLRLLRLNPATGEKIAEAVLDDRVPGTEDNLQVAVKGLNMPVALPDVLVSQGNSVYMRSQQFDLEGNRIAIDIPTRQAREQKGETAHLFCPTGLLDDLWWHRSYWVYGRVWNSGAGGYFKAGRFAPAGRPMVFDEKRVYSFGRKPQYYRWTTPMEYMLYASAKQPPVMRIGGGGKGKKGQVKKKSSLGGMPSTTVRTDWERDVPVLVRGMVLAGNTLFIAGPTDLIDEPRTLRTFDTPETQALLSKQAAALEGAEGATLRAVSAADGTTLGEQKLKDLPVFDGMIAAKGRLYMSTTAGDVVCLGGKR